MKKSTKSSMKKPVLKKAQTGAKLTQTGDKLSKAELSALSHQKRGMGEIRDHQSFVKKSGPIMNETGNLTPSQAKQLREYMSKSSTAEKIYQALPNVGRVIGKSAADVPKNSKLQKQKNGGIIKKSKVLSKNNKK
jgi:hypothetical protein